MQRVIEVLHVLTLLVVITVVTYVGITVVRTLKGLHRDLEQGAIRGEEVLREHRHTQRHLWRACVSPLPVFATHQHALTPPHTAPAPRAVGAHP